jgi:lipopolysaccharide transport system ATP-binding protein
MNAPAIVCEHLKKRYELGAQERYQTLRDAIVRGARRMGRLFARDDNDSAPHVWALNDVSFEIGHGEVIGIIGRNGAGKTTLLKILSRITRPTSGRATVRGRIGSMLEVGTGFHAELTGRENIYLNGAILGMKRAEIDRRFDEIVAFAEIERFLDTTVKRYSSGMYMRLAFAVAAHLEPDILLVDEVLAVGDAAFQKKCLGKMNDAATAGRTVVFVSHNLLAIRDLCTRTIWLEKGVIAASGDSDTVISKYLETASNAIPHKSFDNPAAAPGSDYVRLRRASVAPAGGTPSDAITVRAPVAVEFEYWQLAPGYCPGLSFQLLNQYGILVFETGRPRDPLGLGNSYPAGVYRDVCTIPGDLLNDGAYSIILYFQDSIGAVTHIEHDVVIFEVRDVTELRDNWYGDWRGVVRPPVQWTSTIESSAP